MAIQNFDQLNSIATKWFDAMDISDEEKLQRVKSSIDYCEIMLLIFYMITEEEMEKEECVRFTKERLIIIAENILGRQNLAYINDWAEIEAKNIVNETYKKYENEIEDAALEEEQAEGIENVPSANAAKSKKIYMPEFDVEMPLQEYIFSEERGLLLGLRLSATVYNYKEYLDAIDLKYDRKIWITENDDKVRDTHSVMQGVDIPIHDLFIVGDSYMLMPGDLTYGAELKEIVNCRCHLRCYKR